MAGEVGRGCGGAGAGLLKSVFHPWPNRRIYFPARHRRNFRALNSAALAKNLALTFPEFSIMMLP
jgi:hypothetical protein